MAIKRKYNPKLIALVIGIAFVLPALIVASQTRTHVIPKAAYLKPNLAKLPIPTTTSYVCKPNANPPCPTGFVCMSGICKKPSLPSPTTLTPTPTVQATTTPIINTGYLPSLWEKTQYSYSIQASANRLASMTMKISNLPPGLTTGSCTNSHILPSSVSGNKITASYISCKITGTPTTPGVFSSTINVADDLGNTVTKKINITIRKKPFLTNFLSLFRQN